MRSRFERDRGSVTLEAVIIIPLLLLTVFFLIQVGALMHARNTARSAAQVGVQAARVDGATPADGAAAARTYLAAVAPNTGPATVTASSSAGRVTIRVVMPAPKVVPGLPLSPVDESADGPIEEVSQP